MPLSGPFLLHTIINHFFWLCHISGCFITIYLESVTSYYVHLTTNHNNNTNSLLHINSNASRGILTSINEVIHFHIDTDWNQSVKGSVLGLLFLGHLVDCIAFDCVNWWDCQTRRVLSFLVLSKSTPIHLVHQEIIRPNSVLTIWIFERRWSNFMWLYLLEQHYKHLFMIKVWIIRNRNIEYYEITTAYQILQTSLRNT